MREYLGIRGDKVAAEWRKLHNEELNDLHSSTNIVRVIKSRRMRRAGQVAHMGQRRGAYGAEKGRIQGWWENLRERVHLGDPEVDGRIILRCIFRKWDVGLWTGLSWLMIGTVGGHL